VIYSTGGGQHFACNIFVQGKPLFYDGMERPVLRWQTMAEYHKTKEPIAEMWYLRPVLNPTMTESDSSESPVLALGLKSSAVEADSDSEDSLSQDAMQPAPKRMAKADIQDALLPVQKNPKKNKTYPKGISVQTVAARGKCPVCATCGNTLPRKGRRIVKRQLTNSERNYWAVLSYHCSASCTSWMTPADCKKLPTGTLS
jgi:hypothetical protein